MRKKVVIFGLFIIFWNVIYSQQWTCNTISPNIDFLKDELGFTSYNYTNLSATEHKCIRVYIHIIRTSSGSGGLSASVINNAINVLSTDMALCNIGIDEIGRDFIDNDGFYYGFSDASFYSLINTGYQLNAVNIYILASGISYGRASNIPGVALVLGGNYAGTSVLSHEFGHCLGLYHTHSGSGCSDDANCAENISGSNCSFCGDLVCDTPADPCLSGTVNSSCNYIGGGGYNPNTNNIMSYAPPTCLTDLTNGQIARMHSMIENSPTLQNVLCVTPTLSGPSTLCTTPGTYTLSAGSASSWSVTPSSAFSVISSNDTSVVIKATKFSGQSGTVTAMVGGAPVRKSFTACNVTLNGPSTICLTPATYTLSSGSASSWSVGSMFAFTITSSDDISAVVTPIDYMMEIDSDIPSRPYRGQTGMLTAVVNGATVTKQIQACLLSITGPDIACDTTVYAISDTTVSVVSWHLDGPFTIIDSSSTSVTVVNNRLLSDWVPPDPPGLDPWPGTFTFPGGGGSGTFTVLPVDSLIAFLDDSLPALGTVLPDNSATLTATLSNGAAATRVFKYCTPEIVWNPSFSTVPECGATAIHTISLLNMPPDTEVNWELPPEFTVMEIDSAQANVIMVSALIQGPPHTVSIIARAVHNGDTAYYKAHEYINTPMGITIVVEDCWSESSTASFFPPLASPKFCWLKIADAYGNGMNDLCGRVCWEAIANAGFTDWLYTYNISSLCQPIEIEGDMIVFDDESENALYSAPPEPRPDLPTLRIDHTGDPRYVIVSYNPLVEAVVECHYGEYSATITLPSTSNYSMSATSGTTESAESYTYNIYPNPASSTLYFELTQEAAQTNNSLSQQAGTCKVQLFSAQTGALTFEQTVSDFNSNFNLNVSAVPDGIYVLRMMQNNVNIQMQTVLMLH
jgi:hypothetical protein